MAAGDYNDPLEAARRRFLPQTGNQSFFPAANLKRFDDRSDINDLLGQQPETGFVQPSPTPRPTPAPRSFFPSVGAGFKLTQNDPTDLQGREREGGPITPQEMDLLWKARQRTNEQSRARVMNETPLLTQRSILGRPQQYDQFNQLYGWT